MNPVLDFYITIGIFVLLAIGGMKLSKLDNLMSSWISGKNSSKKTSRCSIREVVGTCAVQSRIRIDFWRRIFRPCLLRIFMVSAYQ